MASKGYTLLEYLVSLDTELAKLKKVVSESVGTDYSELIANINGIRNELNIFKTTITDTVDSNNSTITSQVNTLTSQFNTFKTSLENQVNEISTRVVNVEERVLTLENNQENNVSQPDTIVDKTIINGVLNLGTEKYQKCTMENNTQISLPSVTIFTEIHLFFTTTEDLTLTLPNCKWQSQPTITGNKDYELIFTYTDKWLGGCIVYE